MGVISVSIFLLAMVVAASPYRDYPASRMPDYGIDDENHEIIPTPDDFVDKLPHIGASLDYKYEEESDSRKPDLDVEVDDTIINKNKRFSPKSTSEDIHVDIYNTQEEIIMPEDAPRKRKGKINRRKHNRINSESGNSILKHSRNREVQDDITDNEDYRVREEDYREKDEKEADRYHRKEIINRQARRKPRERPINLILRDSESQYIKIDEEVNDHEEKKSQSQERHFNKPEPPKVFEYEFDDMRRVNNLKGKLTVTPRRTTVNMLEPSRTSRSHEWPNRRENIPDDTSLELKKITSTLGSQLAALNKSETSLAERSRLSILKKVNKKEMLNFTLTAKPPVLMQVTNKLQTVVMIEPHSDKELPQVRQVIDDSPQRVGVAKRLMRLKLAANARSVQELADNWDELICDYIDVSLLNVACRLSRGCSFHFILASLVLSI